jgi:hypothetical protein
MDADTAENGRQESREGLVLVLNCHEANFSMAKEGAGSAGLRAGARRGVVKKLRLV